jgi:hypothetical protein
MTSTQNTLRTRQNMEVLDVFKNLNSQVNALTKRQIAVFPDTLKPKTQRDMEVEVNVDKSVEGLNSLLETRLASLEFVLKNDAQLTNMAMRPRMVIEDDDIKIEDDEDIDFSSLTTKASRELAERKYREREARREAEARVREAEAKEAISVAKAEGIRESASQLKLIPFQRAYNDIINTGSVVSLWNNIVRFYQKSGLSRQSQEMVKVKVQDLIPNLEAYLYGLSEAVNVLFSSNRYNNQIGLKVLELLRTQSVYQIIKVQIDTASFDIISVPMMDTAFKNIFASLSQERRNLLDEVASRGNISNKPIRLIPEFRSDNFNQRMKALADEMGIDVSALPAPLVRRLKAMNQADFEKSAVEAIKTVKSEKSSFSAFQERALSDIQRLQVEVLELTLRKDEEIPREIARLQENIVLLGEDHKGRDVGDNEDLVEVPVLRPMPDMLDYAEDEDGYFNRDMDAWRIARAEYDRANEINDQIRNDNEMRDALRVDVAQTQELRNEYLRRIKLLEDESDELTLQITTKQEELDEKVGALTERDTALAPTIKTALTAIVNAYPIQPTQGLRPFRPIVAPGVAPLGRGLAGMGSHYGAEDDSEESDSDEESDEEDPLAFDDRRNDSYYSRPTRR